jgi:hypothetical protein
VTRAVARGRVLLLCGGLALGCAVDVQVIRYPEAPELPARPEGCAVTLRDWHKLPESTCVDLGDVYVGDRGLMLFGCGRERADREIRAEACRLGADTALVRRIRDPHSICKQARARLLRCDAGALGPTP